MIPGQFWANKRVFITGHTGFKGSWLCLWLHKLGAKVAGYALNPPSNPSLYDLCKINELIELERIADIREGGLLKQAMQEFQPEIVIHMAAQPLVRESYKYPVETYSINVMGTVHLFEAVRTCGSVKAVVNVTTDKCYENKEWVWSYRENEPMGGYDPYSNSKACSELVTSSYRDSFFHPEQYKSHGVAVASARAGNVIGGGDWASDRLIPDCIRSLIKNEVITIRNPNAIRPWQHVLEPISGYLLLAQKLYEEGPKYVGGWNFGPYENDAKTVEWIVARFCEEWGSAASFQVDEAVHPHEANYLKLDCSKAMMVLGWKPRWTVDSAISNIITWTSDYTNGNDLRSACFKQIDEYTKLSK